MPWASIQEDQELFIDEEFLPSGFTLREPTRLKEQEMIRLLRFWLDRQDSGTDIPFKFKAYRQSDGTVVAARKGFSNLNSGYASGDELADDQSNPRNKEKKKSIHSGGKRSVDPKQTKGKRGATKRNKGKASKSKPRVDFDEESDGEFFDFSKVNDSSDDDSQSDVSTPPTVLPLPESGLKPSRPRPRPLAKANSSHHTSACTPTSRAGEREKSQQSTETQSSAVTAPIPDVAEQSNSHLSGRDKKTQEIADGIRLPPGSKIGPPGMKRKRVEGNLSEVFFSARHWMIFITSS